MTIPTSLIVVRIMPNQENSRVNPAVIFDNFCNSCYEQMKMSPPWFFDFVTP